MLKLGTSGFSYPDWKGNVYPQKLQPKDTLKYYEQELGFDCVEVKCIPCFKTCQNIPAKIFLDFQSQKTYNEIIETVKKIANALGVSPEDLIR